MPDAPKEPETPDPKLSGLERELGMDRDITRRDFMGTVALGTGAALLGSEPPAMRRALSANPSDASAPPWHPWTGYGGVGDHARSNGNTWEVVNAGHGIRDSTYEQQIARATVTGETYDLVVVGGGYAGVVAAYNFLKTTGRKRSCLLMDNHPIIGGEAKRNEFLVRGHRLAGPQGSNQSSIPKAGMAHDIWTHLGMPTGFEFGTLPPGRKAMEFPHDNYFYLLWADQSENHGFFFDSPRPHWVTNPWGHNLEGTPWPSDVRRDLLRWRDEPMEPFKGDETSLERWLDTMTYEQYLTNVRKLHPEVARYVDPMLASGLGLGSDVMSANAAYYFSYPGFQGLSRKPPTIAIPERKLANAPGHSFPGGNDGVMRYLVKWLNP
ncbi:MAG: NAD(P)-binding protein, partial [Gemmatimonadaceae bacterium]